MAGRVSDRKVLEEDENGTLNLPNDHLVTNKQFSDYFEMAFKDVVLPLVIGAEKGYPLDNWKQPNGIGSSHKENCASMFRHLAEHSVGQDKVHDADIDPLLCVACRALMAYYRKTHGIINDKD